MIKVTLEFATIEEVQMALERLKPTTAVKAVVDQTAGTEKAAAAAKASMEKAAKVEAPKPAPTQAVAETPAAKPAAAAAAPSDGAVDYTVVAAAINSAVKDRRDHVVATLGKFGAKKGTELKAEQYAAFLAELG